MFLKCFYYFKLKSEWIDDQAFDASFKIIQKFKQLADCGIPTHSSPSKHS